jgi:hypothetical protein
MAAVLRTPQRSFFGMVVMIKAGSTGEKGRIQTGVAAKWERKRE